MKWLSLADLPAFNATLNAISAILLITGWWLIRSGRWKAHLTVMLTALLTSSIFLTSYLIFHAHIGSIRFTDPRPIRYVYYVLLLTHVLLAFLVLPLILITLSRAARRRFSLHRKIARWTLPIWLYVSVTGVLVYFMNYQWFPSKEIETKLHSVQEVKQ